MKLIEIFQHLATGELSQLSIGGGTSGEINEKNHDRIVAHLNLGLTALYTRFLLKERKVRVSLQADRLVYPLVRKYAASNTESTEPVKFLWDSLSDPFLDDVLKIEQVYTAYGIEMPLNARTRYSLTTPVMNRLAFPKEIVEFSPELPEELKTTWVMVNYRACHPIIDTMAATFDPETYEVELPYSHLMALLYFVASRLHNPIGMINEFHSGNSYAAKYEAECQRLELANIRIDPIDQESKLERNGWA